MLIFAQSSVPVETVAEPAISFFDAVKIAFPSGLDALIFVALVVVGLSAGKILKHFLLCISGKLRSRCEGRGGAFFIAADALFRALPLLGLSAGILAYRLVYFPVPADTPGAVAAAALLDRAFWIFGIVAQTQVLWNLVRLPMRFIKNYAEKNHRNSAFASLVPLTGAILQVLVVFWGILLCVRVVTDTSPAEILAMIGIGGLAVSLASQDTVKNFFGTAMLVIDCPFSVGDVIDIGTGTPGTVVRIGLRSTRLRTVDDHEISIPNADLANRVVTTISSREKIRRVMNLGLTYDTPPKKIEEAVAIVKEILNRSGKLAPGSPPTVFFSDFTDSTLNIRVIYAYADSDIAAANTFAHEVNLEILRRFADAEISFAFPTQTVELRKI
ncbi:MAG: mechanosensitive ion channel family protein [Opitutales bacterium]|nr:mechanosensitive ion channel family protein [Opitutales bacterium]